MILFWKNGRNNSVTTILVTTYHFSNNISFQAYSIHDVEVGYCQGSAFIVGLLLLQVRWCILIKELVRVMLAFRKVVKHQ